MKRISAIILVPTLLVTLVASAFAAPHMMHHGMMMHHRMMHRGMMMHKKAM